MLAVVNRRNSRRESEFGEMTHVGCTRNRAICARPIFWRYTSSCYEESSVGTWPSDAPTAAVVASTSQSIIKFPVRLPFGWRIAIQPYSPQIHPAMGPRRP